MRCAYVAVVWVAEAGEQYGSPGGNEFVGSWGPFPESERADGVE